MHVLWENLVNQRVDTLRFKLLVMPVQIKPVIKTLTENTAQCLRFFTLQLGDLRSSIAINSV